MTKPTPTLAVLAHRALARDSALARPRAMQDVLTDACVSTQWWNQLKRGLIASPDDERVEAIAEALGVSLATFRRSLAETRRRLLFGEDV